ncbi:MAG: ACP phosphodiesterase [Brumimicrobium sp.]
MNFLGHLYFSNDDLDLMVANLYGDFVKGKDYSYLPKIVQTGVTLHRNIDDFIDNHLEVKELRLKLYPELPKIAGIAIDLYFDHLLAKNWNQFHQTPLDEFADAFTEYVKNPNNLYFPKQDFTYSNEYLHLLKMMGKYGWLKRYREMEGLAMASEGLAKRIAVENNLEDAPLVFIKHEKEIEVVFKNYMKDAKIRFQEFLNQ